MKDRLLKKGSYLGKVATLCIMGYRKDLLVILTSLFFYQSSVVPCRTFPLFSIALSNPDGQKAIVTTMKQKFNKEQDHSTVY